MLHNLKIKHRIILIFSIIGIVGIIGMLHHQNNTDSITSKLNGMYNKQIKSLTYLVETEQLIHNAHIQVQQILHSYQSESNEQIQTRISKAKDNIKRAKSKFTLFKDQYVQNQNPRIKSLNLTLQKYAEVTNGISSYIVSSYDKSRITEYYEDAYLPTFYTFQNELEHITGQNTIAIENTHNESINYIQTTQSVTYWYFLAIILLIGFIGFFFSYNLTRPLNKVANFIQTLSTGELPEHFTNVTKDEIGRIKSVLNTYVSNLKRTVNFAKQIGEGNLEEDYQPLSEKDSLGNALLEMRKGLRQAREDEKKRKEEDEKRNWVTQGLAKFGDILRKDNENVEKLADDVLSNLIDYVGAIQGGLFIYNSEEDNDEQEPYLELISSYAYNRKKYKEKYIKLGEGLVGTCAIEKETIYMTEIPDEYVEITSGLGDANPNSLVIVPLKIEDEIFGVVELASLKPFEQYQIEFIEKVGENIASTISSVRTNNRTAVLLEQSKQQAEEMQTKEEELRQNMEELKSTQEEMERLRQRESEKNKEMLDNMENQRKMMVQILDQLPERIFVKDNSGKILIANNAIAKAQNTTTDELVGKTDYDLYDFETAQNILNEEEETKKSGTRTYTQTIEQNGDRKIVKTTKMPFYIKHLDQKGILSVQQDITEYTELQEREKELQERITQLNKELGVNS